MSFFFALSSKCTIYRCNVNNVHTARQNTVQYAESISDLQVHVLAMISIVTLRHSLQSCFLLPSGGNILWIVEYQCGSYSSERQTDKFPHKWSCLD